MAARGRPPGVRALLDEAPLVYLIIVAVLVAALLGLGLAYAAYIAAEGLPAHPVPFWEAPLGASRLESYTRIGFAGAAIVVGAGAAVIAFRAQRIREKSDEREKERLLQDRFLSASEQLGSENSTVRIAGVYVMTRLANSLEDSYFRQQCVDVLCAYLRMPERTVVDRASVMKIVPDPLDLEVRSTIQAVLSSHLKLDRPDRWRDVDLDLRGARMRRLSLDNCQIRNLNMETAEVVGDFFMQDAEVGGQANFRGGRFLGLVTFRNTQFKGRARFYGAQFHKSAGFFSTVFDERAIFFDSVFYMDASFGAATFAGTAAFERTHFQSKASYGGAQFLSAAKFCDAQFDSTAIFTRTRFEGEADFARSSFKRPVFKKSRFLIAPSFGGATRSGGLWTGP